ncbi:MAG: DUF5711 family protein [Lachnospiraceae bacterium]|nr:DUF5711 family protein [Lachnospiraceae bacterium]
MQKNVQDKLVLAYEKVKDFVIKHKKISIGVCVVILVAIIWRTFSLFYTYTDYTIKYDTTMEDSDGTAYESFHNNIVKYNSDGAFYVSKQGDLMWNEAFDMLSPNIDISNDYVALYDRAGTDIYVMDTIGKKGTIRTSKPILTACVADNGSVAALMNQKDVSYLEIRDLEGELIASGELHVENSGIPIDIAFSEDGEKLAVSSISFNAGSLQTIISFYNFSKSGQQRQDNIVGTFSFTDVVMPQIIYMSNGNLVAFGDKEIAVFNDSFEPALKKEIYPQGSIDSIFYNKDHFGYIGPETTESGETIKKLYVFGKSGWKKLNKAIDDPYTKVYMLTNDDVVLTTDKTAVIHGISGVKKFEYEFENSIVKILYGGSGNDYIFVQNGVIQDVRLR